MVMPLGLQVKREKEKESKGYAKTDRALEKKYRREKVKDRESNTQNKKRKTKE